MIDQEKAKQILQAIHRGEAVACATECDAAWDLLERDEDLQEWYRVTLTEASDFDQPVVTKLAEIGAAQGAEARLVSVLARKRRPVVRIARLLLPLAAAAALVVAGLTLFNGDDGTPVIAERSGSTLDAFRGDMANFALDGLKLQHRSKTLPKLKSWLAERESPMGDILEKEITASASIGCAVVGWGGSKVSLICFRTAKNGVVHMFVIERSTVDDDGLEAAIANNIAKSGLETAGWADDNNVYLLVASSAKVSLDGLL